MNETKQAGKLENTYSVQDSPGYLIARARMKLTKAVDAEVASMGITGQQGAVLMLLGGGQCSTASDLARELYIDSASMTRLLDRLEKRGLIMRQPSAQDRRVVSLILTEEGQALLPQLPPRYGKVLETYFARFSADDLATLKRLLKTLLDEENPT